MQIVNLLVATLGSVMSLVVLVVALMYVVYIPDEPRLAGQLPKLLVISAVFAAPGALGWLAFWAWLRRRPYRFIAEAALAAAVGGGGLILVAVLRA